MRELGRQKPHIYYSSFFDRWICEYSGDDDFGLVYVSGASFKEAYLSLRALFGSEWRIGK